MFGQQVMSKTRHNLTQLHRPVMLKLVMVERSFPFEETIICGCYKAQFFIVGFYFDLNGCGRKPVLLSGKGGDSGIQRINRTN